MTLPMQVEGVLVVDLDGTLVRTDMLYESFWSAFGRDWRAPHATIRALFDGKAALKRRLAELGAPEVETLPYNPAVLDYVRNWRAAGGRTALVTAADQQIAEAIARHLGLFDEVHGTQDGLNLRGEAKAAFLAQRFGEGAFAYIGNEAADLPVWARAGRAVVVDAPGGVIERVDRMTAESEELSHRERSLRAYLRALRPHQWLKNLLIFLPVLAAHDLSGGGLARAALAFAAFCLVASGVYVVNDLVDLAADRAHPRKRNRPFASGAVPVRHGTVMAPALLLAGLLAGLVAGPAFAAVLVGYTALTTGYSFSFKKVIVLDICVLAGLYTMRLLAGAAATGTPLSVWLLGFSTFFFFSLAAVKRQAELVDGVATGQVTAKGRGYRVSDLPVVAGMAVAAGFVSVLVMALYVTSPDIRALYHRPEALWAICPVLLYWISRMVMLTHRGEMHDDPVVFAVRDRASLVCFVVILGAAVAGAVL